MSVLSINNANFEAEVMNSEVPVLVDFWASWCGPCKMFAPVVDQVAEEHEGKVKVCKINIDEEPELAQKYQVMSIPTLVLIEGGELKKTSVGVINKKAVEDFIS